MSDLVRLSKHRSLYVGPVSSTSTRQLRTKSTNNDRVALSLIRERPAIYHRTNQQATHPRTYHDPVLRHRHPLHIIPEHRGHTRYIRGSSLYNQQVVRQIGELSRLL
jgi:hypothetical protein